jgi:2,3-dihydroxybiphenyl 1,2-dioxygenase
MRATGSAGPVRSLGYLEVEATDLDSWQQFATDILGMQAVVRDETVLRLKMDVRTHRITVRRSDRDRVAAMGWELGAIDDLERVTRILKDEGFSATIGGRDLAESRGVADLISVDDPGGNRLEFFVGARTEEARRFHSLTGAHFVTGPLGMGHVTLVTARYEEMFRFYSHVLGFHISDYLVGDELQAAFMGPNQRHHSLAIIDSHGTVETYDHFMVEVDDLETVGRAYDRCFVSKQPLSYTLGKHWNDHMTSFYVQSPSGFDVEYGWRGRLVDRDEWTPVQGTGEISIWGHHATSQELAQRRGLSTWFNGLSLAV